LVERIAVTDDVATRDLLAAELFAFTKNMRSKVILVLSLGLILPTVAVADISVALADTISDAV
jgi:hypothetical protein